MRTGSGPARIGCCRGRGRRPCCLRGCLRLPPPSGCRGLILLVWPSRTSYHLDNAITSDGATVVRSYRVWLPANPSRPAPAFLHHSVHLSSFPIISRVFP